VFASAGAAMFALSLQKKDSEKSSLRSGKKSLSTQAQVKQQPE
jgi:hypothetical protein